MATLIPAVSSLPTAPNRATDNATSFSTKADAMMNAIVTMMTELQAYRTALNLYGLDLDNAISAAVTAVNAPGSGGTSVSPVLVGTGSKSFTTNTGKLWGLGQWVIIADTTAPGTNWMAGPITAYNSGTGLLTVNVLSTGGSGTISTWTISLTAPGTGFAATGAIIAQTYTAFSTGGLGTAYTLTPVPAISSYVAGQSFWVTFHTASGASPTLTINGVATPPTLVKQLPDGSYANIAANDFPTSHRSKVTMLSATQALVETMPRNSRVIGTLTATTSGASVDITGIPSWAKEIDIMFDAVSSTGTSPYMVQIGDSGGIETTGYLGAASQLTNAGAVVVANFTSGFGVVGAAAAGTVIHGVMTLRLMDSATNKWVASVNGGQSNATVTFQGGGAKSTSATLDRIRLTTVGGTDTFDAGNINIIYRG